MKRIFIGIPSAREDVDFFVSMSKFLPAIKEKYEINSLQVKGLNIADARNIIVEKFLESGFEYLLFLDDDHSNHTVEMVDALVRAGTYMCGIKCYTKSFPHCCTLLDYSGHPQWPYKPKENKYGYAVCDLVGFGMTLLKRELFLKMKKPYFVGIGEKAVKEDNYFCAEMEKIGIKPVGCFDFTLTHGGFDESNVPALNKIGTDKFLEELKKKFPENYLNGKTVYMCN